MVMSESNTPPREAASQSENVPETEQTSEAASQGEAIQLPPVIRRPVQEILRQYLGIDDVSAKVHITPSPTAKGIRTEICVDIEGVVIAGDAQYREYLSDVPVVVYATAHNYNFRILQGQTDIFGRICSTFTPTWVGDTLILVLIPLDEGIWILCDVDHVRVLDYDEYIKRLVQAYERLQQLRRAPPAAKQSEAASQQQQPSPQELYQIKILRAAVEAEQKRIRLGSYVETPFGKGWVLALDLNRKLVIVIINGQKFEVPLDQVKPAEGS